MYFTKVELHNFGIYKGTHEMCLTDQIGNRNITLVGGLNGRGKTTFHDAILIALYGKQALKYMTITLLLRLMKESWSEWLMYIALTTETLIAEPTSSVQMPKRLCPQQEKPLRRSWL